MADNQDQDKTEKATPYKLEESRKKGQVSKSLEINHFFQLLIFTTLLISLVLGIIKALNLEFVKIFSMAGQFVFTIDNIFVLFIKVAIATIGLVLPIYLINLLVGVTSTIVQTKPVLTTFPLKPDFSRLNPAKGFKKLFSIKILFELFKTILKIIVFVAIIYIALSMLLPKLFALIAIKKNYITPGIIDILSFMGYLTVILLVPIAVIDKLFTKWDFAKQMKMSKREIKDEYKKREGHPEIRSKRKELHKELVTKASALSKVKDSDMIITNPTHIAVALFYDAKIMASPIVIAKGSGDLAARIQKLGKKYKKPIFRKPPLARLLFKKISIGNPIPEETFNEIAPIYNWLIKNKTEDI